MLNCGAQRTVDTQCLVVRVTLELAHGVPNNGLQVGRNRDLSSCELRQCSEEVGMRFYQLRDYAAEHPDQLLHRTDRMLLHQLLIRIFAHDVTLEVHKYLANCIIPFSSTESIEGLHRLTVACLMPTLELISVSAVVSNSCWKFGAGIGGW